MFNEVCRCIAAQLNIPVESVKPDSRLVEDLKADSLDIVELVMSFEERYDVEIPDEDLIELKTVEAIVNYIESKSK